MQYEIVSGGAIAVVSAIVGYLIAKRFSRAQFDLYTDQAKAKAKAIEVEAEMILNDASLKAQKMELRAQKKYDDALLKAKQDLADEQEQMSRRKTELQRYISSEREQIKQNRVTSENRKISLERQSRALDKLKVEYEQRLDEAMRAIEKSAHMSQDEAEQILLKQIEQRSRSKIAQIVKKHELEATKSAEQKANYIIALATSRYAGTFSHERLISIIHLDDDELKGRIIGKEGRNIKSLEMVMGVDIIVDETPQEIVVSSFSLYRRAIAVRSLELLIEDGRIHPARIEQIHAKVVEEFEQSALLEAEELVYEMGITQLHPELLKLLGRLRYRASYGQNALAHTLEVADLAGMIAAELGGDIKLAKRAGLLHDIGKALTHEVEGNHVDLGAEICKRYGEHEVVINAIYAHHGQEEILSIECAAVCAADALSAARPGARREVLENFLKRVTQIEEIASSHLGVKQAYAINAGREVRVIVNAELVDDDESFLLAKEIAQSIENDVNYPGEVKVNVIRETRSVEYAK